MKQVEIATAIIMKDHKILTTRRGYGQFINLWEFPGGKIESGETTEDALIRELQEELAVEVIPEELFMTTEYDYPDFHLTMHCYLCSIKKGTITLLEHNGAKWLDKDHLDTVEWLPANQPVIDGLREMLSL